MVGLGKTTSLPTTHPSVPGVPVSQSPVPSTRMVCNVRRTYHRNPSMVTGDTAVPVSSPPCVASRTRLPSLFPVVHPHAPLVPSRDRIPSGRTRGCVEEEPEWSSWHGPPVCVGSHDGRPVLTNRDPDSVHSSVRGPRICSRDPVLRGHFPSPLGTLRSPGKGPSTTSSNSSSFSVQARRSLDQTGPLLESLGL